ncbi:MAG: hypothetical protein QOH41_571 [Blastocatellia bacterium]|nr:hypothetical protein [Blastocatellia bacterium]
MSPESPSKDPLARLLRERSRFPQSDRKGCDRIRIRTVDPSSETYPRTCRTPSSRLLFRQSLAQRLLGPLYESELRRRLVGHVSETWA